MRPGADTQLVETQGDGQGEHRPSPGLLGRQAKPGQQVGDEPDPPVGHPADGVRDPQLPEGAPTDPGVWAREAFSVAGMPRWVRAALAVRQLLVPLLGIPRAPDDTFAVQERAGDEVLIAADDRHLDFRCGIAVDPAARLLRVTTTVRLHGWRGRLYFAPVRILHPIVVQAMIRTAGRRLAGRG